MRFPCGAGASGSKHLPWALPRILQANPKINGLAGGGWAAGRGRALRFVRSDDRNYGAVRFSRDGNNLLTITGSGSIEALDGNSGELRVRICCSTIYGEVGFSPDGRLIVSAGHWPALWEAQSGHLAGRLTKNREFYSFRPIAFDERRGTILMGSQDGRGYAWDLRTPQLRAISRAHLGYVDTIVVLRSDGWVAYAGSGGPIRLWNPDTGQERALASARPASNLDAEPDGVSILFGTASGSAGVWDTQEGKLLRRLAQ